MGELFDKIVKYNEVAKAELQFNSERELFLEIDSRIKTFGKGPLANIIVIAGLRGTGKTTILKSLAKKYDNSIYSSGDNLVSNKISLEEVMFVSNKLDKKIILLDEIHYLKNWANELKIIADLYQKTMFIVTGSSSLLLRDLASTLKRRALFYTIYPLSFREFLKMKYKINILKDEDLFELIFNEPNLEKKYFGLLKINGALQKGLYPKFQEYLTRQFPITINEPVPYLITKDLIERVIEKDIPAITNLNTKNLLKISQIIEYLSLSDKVSLTKISNISGLNYDTVEKIMVALEKADILRNLEPYNVTNRLKNIKRYIFTAPSVRVAYGFYNVKRAQGYAREDLFATIIKSLNLEPKYIFEENQYDFVVNNVTFEIGARSKKIKTNEQVVVIVDGQDLELNNKALYIPFELFALLQ